MEIPHPDLPKVTGMILVEIRSVVMLSSGHTASTGVLAVLAYSSVAGGDVTAAVGGMGMWLVFCDRGSWPILYEMGGEVEGKEKSNRGDILLARLAQSSGHVGRFDRLSW